MMISSDDLKALGPRGKPRLMKDVAAAANLILPHYEINTPLRVCHFWAQVAHECARFQTMQEYWGPTEAQKRYEGRKDLGNDANGDGYKYRGRGLIQITGKANYREMSNKLGVDLVYNPDLACDPEIAVQIACEYWKSRGLNALADKNDIVAITKRVNGGLNGLADRRALFNTAWSLWGNQDRTPAPAKSIVTSKTANATVATGTASGIGLAAAYEAGKDAVSKASEIKDAAESAGNLVGISGNMALLIGCVLIIAVGCAFIIWDRKRKLETEGV